VESERLAGLAHPPAQRTIIPEPAGARKPRRPCRLCSGGRSRRPCWRGSGGIVNHPSSIIP